MLTWTNSTSASQSGGTTYSSTPAIVTGTVSNVPAVFVWCATARDNTTTAGGTKGSKFDLATRTASQVYMVGLKEVVEIQVADNLPWQWRRICFTYKGFNTLNGALPVPSTSFNPAIEISVGYVRVLNQLSPSQQTTFFQLLFQGGQAQDWQDPLTAKLDTERLSIKYDKTCTIASGNEGGVIRKYNKWHPMRHNLMYDDDESGGSVIPISYSVDSRRGMGDYWVVDIIKPRMGAGASNQLSFNCESTLYWHER